MTMRFVPTTNIASNSSHPLNALFALLDFMRTASPVGPGWSIPRSSNGSVGGDGDNIASAGDLSQFSSGTSESWFVLRSPDGAKEFLFYRATTDDKEWVLNYSPTASFIGGDEGNEATAVDALGIIGGARDMTSQAVSVLHLGADDAAPYGWFSYMHDAGNFASSRGMGFAWCPIDAGLQPGDTDPYVFVYGIGTSEGFKQSIMINETNTNTTTAGRVFGIPPGQAISRTIPALRLVSSSNEVFPNGAALDDNSNDLSIPVPFGVRAGLSAPRGFKGFSSFIQWNGVERAAGETFANRTRVSWGDVNFPWDGSVPLDS